MFEQNKQKQKNLFNVFYVFINENKNKIEKSENECDIFITAQIYSFFC